MPDDSQAAYHNQSHGHSHTALRTTHDTDPCGTLFDSPQRIGKRISMTYKQSLLKQVYKLVLQIDLLGNPLALARAGD